MKMKHGLSLTAVCAASLLAGNVSAAVIGPIATEVSDIELRGAGHAWVGQTTARIGRDVGGGSLGNNYLAVFALPTLASGESISSADFQFNLKTTATNFNGEDPFNIDVYGVRGSNSSAVIDVADFFVGADDTGTTKIEDDILTLGAGPSTGSAPGVYTTSSGVALGAWLSTLYGGDETPDVAYAFIRLSPDALASSTSGSHFFTIYSNITDAPTLTITTAAVPEPASMALIGVGSLVMLRRKMR